MNQPSEATAELELSECQAAALPTAEAPVALLYVAMLRAQILLTQRSPEAQPLLQRIAKRISAENGPDAWIQGLYELARAAQPCGTSDRRLAGGYPVRKLNDRSCP